MTVKFSVDAVRDRDDRTRVVRRKRQLIEQYSTALGGIQTQQRTDVEKAAELVSLLELAWVNGGSADATPEEEAAFLRLGGAAAEAVAKLGLPATSVDRALKGSAAVDGLMSKSAGPLGGITLF